MPLGTEIGLGLRNIVFDVDPATPRKKAHPSHPIFRLCLFWQTAGWIKMPLGTEVNVGSGDVVLDGVAAPPKRGAAPSFRFMRLDG